MEAVISTVIVAVMFVAAMNTVGTADPNGLYVINASNANLLIRKCRIYGTLVVQAGTGP